MTDRTLLTYRNQTVRVSIRVDDAWEEILLSEMSDAGFHGFEQGAETLIGYIDQQLWTDERRTYFVDWLEAKQSTVSMIEDVVAIQNWNAIWEASIEPVCAGGFVILPSWREAPIEAQELVEIRIDPKMSFGTGHHETTRLILEIMAVVKFDGTTVLDAGTGTAVLAIAAKKLGADRVVGFDIDLWSITNAKENIALNSIADIEILTGGIDSLAPEFSINGSYDVIVANIIQVVIEEMLPDFNRLLSAQGDLLISGILQTGEAELIRKARALGFESVHRMTENEWVGLHFVRC